MVFRKIDCENNSVEISHFQEYATPFNVVPPWTAEQMRRYLL